MTSFDDEEKLIARLADHSEQVIGVDGFDGAGKSTFAAKVASATRRRHVDLDALLTGHQMDAFVEFIDADKLAATVDVGSPLVISGICLRQVLELAGVSVPQVHVYVRKMHLGAWDDAGEADGANDEVQRFDRQYPPSFVRLEIRRYHELWRPHLNADYLLDRDTSPDWARQGAAEAAR